VKICHQLPNNLSEVHATNRYGLPSNPSAFGRNTPCTSRRYLLGPLVQVGRKEEIHQNPELDHSGELESPFVAVATGHQNNRTREPLSKKGLNHAKESLLPLQESAVHSEGAYKHGRHRRRTHLCLVSRRFGASRRVSSPFSNCKQSSSGLTFCYCVFGCRCRTFVVIAFDYLLRL
jgi:hypothetical protein